MLKKIKGKFLNEVLLKMRPKKKLGLSCAEVCKSLDRINSFPNDGPATEEDEGAARRGHRAAGFGDAVSRKKEAKGAASGRRQKDSSGDQGTQSTKKAKVEPKEKRSHIYCCRSGDSCAIINKISLTMYIILW